MGRLEPGLSADEVMASFEKTVVERRIFHKKIDGLLQEHLYPMLDNIEGISDQDEEELYATAQKLSSYATRLDPGLALKIYQALLLWARKKQDEAKTIRYLYWCGITTFFFFRGQNQNSEQDDKIISYFEEGVTYRDRYHTYTDPETRQYIHRCLGNLSMMLYYRDESERAMALEESSFSYWNGLLFSGIDLDFPWLNYFLACLLHRRAYLMTTAHKDPDSATKTELRDILEISIIINKLYYKNIEAFSVFGGTRYEFILWEAQFLSGLISFDHLYENIYRKKAEFKDDDYSSDAMYVKIQLNSYLMFYAAKMRKLRDRKDEIIAAIAKDSIEAFSRLPMTVSPSSVSEHVQFFAKNLSDIFDPAEQMDFILKMTTFRHIPTYAHSIIVGKISVCLTKHLIEKNPGCFTGCMGIASADEAILRADEIIRIVEIAGLCHDIGKISYISNPFMHTRVLTAEESSIIKGHPNDGVGLLVRDDDIHGNDAYLDIIRGHHRYYDNSGGYPEDFDTGTSSYKILIDVIAAANSLEAGTDGIGKTYTEPKTADEIISEIITGAGVRYSPHIAEVLKDDSVTAEIRRILDIDRREAYHTAYLHAWEENSAGCA